MEPFLGADVMNAASTKTIILASDRMIYIMMVITTLISDTCTENRVGLAGWACNRISHYALIVISFLDRMKQIYSM